MCRNIKPLFNFDPPATDDEIHACALQYVRKVTGMRDPTMGNKAAYDAAVAAVEAATRGVVSRLVTRSPPRTREEEAERAAERGRKREQQLKARYAPG